MFLSTATATGERQTEYFTLPSVIVRTPYFNKIALTEMEFNRSIYR